MNNIKKQRSRCGWWRVTSPWARDFLAETAGTLVLVVFGCGSIAQSVLSLGLKGDFFSINWGWCIGAVLGLLLSSEVSGGHINPAVTVALATLGKFPWRKVPLYLLAQYLGAFLGSVIVFLVYWEAIVFYEHDRGGYRVTPDTAAIFGTYPGHHLTLWGGVTDQLVATALLLICICAIQDRNNMKVSKQVIPFFIGLTILAIGVCFGYNCGYAINPARDLGPRLFSLMSGWGLDVFTKPSYYWWIVPVITTHIGAILGAWIYYLAIEVNWPPADSSEQMNGLDLGPLKAGAPPPMYNFRDEVKQRSGTLNRDSHK